MISVKEVYVRCISGKQTYRFDVAGVIAASSRIYVTGANITIDAFTASSPGITIKNYGIKIEGSRGAHDVIVRGVRVQITNNQVSVEDGISVHSGAYNVVIDHVSVRGATDENIGINNAHDVTVSWSILAEPHSSHSMLIANRASRVSVHHTLFIKAQQRNPQVNYDDTPHRTQDTETTLDTRNNIVWDWGCGYGTRIRYGVRANAVNNFYSSDKGMRKMRSSFARAYLRIPIAITMPVTLPELMWRAMSAETG